MKTLLLGSFILGLTVLSLHKTCALFDCPEPESPVSLEPNGTYVPLGLVRAINGMETYETGRVSSTMLIGVYDIYGFSPSTNIWEICDKLGENYRVALPDFFRGVPWDREHYPYPKDKSFKDFVRATSWEESVRADLRSVIDHYKTLGVTKFGIFGFCFGGGITAKASAEFDEIVIAAQLHPAGVNISDAAVIRAPSILLPGANDPDMTEYCSIINANLGEGSCTLHQFTNVNHGYAGGRADWNNGTVRAAAEEAVYMFEEFLCQHQF